MIFNSMKYQSKKVNSYTMQSTDQVYCVSNEQDKTVSLLFISKEISEVDEVLGGSQVQIKLTCDQFHDLRKDLVKLLPFLVLQILRLRRWLRSLLSEPKGIGDIYSSLRRTLYGLYIFTILQVLKDGVLIIAAR